MYVGQSKYIIHGLDFSKVEHNKEAHSARGLDDLPGHFLHVDKRISVRYNLRYKFYKDPEYLSQKVDTKVDKNWKCTE